MSATSQTVPMQDATRQPGSAWTDRIPTSTRSITSVGLLTTAGFVLTFGLWGAMAPLSAAAVARGHVAAAGRNVQLQHLEGGIVSKILVHEGDRVTAGEELFRLNAAAVTAQLNRLRAQLFALEAKAVRLEGERNGLEDLVFPPRLLAEAGTPDFARVIAEQRVEFSVRREGQRRELAVLAQQIEALERQAEGYGVQRASLLEQILIMNGELERKRGLLEKGLTSRADYNSSLLSRAQLDGQVGATDAQSLSARSQVAENREQIARQESRRLETAAAELNETRSQIADLQQQVAAAEAVEGRVSVRAPSDGIVVKINFNAEGSVVTPGQSLAEILPTSDDLIVEARLTPQDVDAVHMMQPAELRFTSLNRLTPPATGMVTFVSPDRLLDPRTEEPYYIARLRLEDPLPDGVDRSRIYPGMPVDAYITTGSRSFFAYLFQPLTDSFSRAFRESD